MPRNKKITAKKPPPAPYGMLIPCLLIVVFVFPKPRSIGGWLLYGLALLLPFSVGAAYAVKAAANAVDADE